MTRLQLEQMSMKLVAMMLLVTVSIPGTALAAARSTGTHTHAKHITRRAAGMTEGAKQYYVSTWGVDQFTVKLAESGQLVRFDYRVVDASKAKALNSQASTPQLFDELQHVVLQIPTMEKVGPLRQSMEPETGKVYWMVFSNKGNFVKPGHRVSVLIGPVRIDGLIVQ